MVEEEGGDGFQLQHEQHRVIVCNPPAQQLSLPPSSSLPPSLQAYSTFSWLASGVLDGIPPTILDGFPRLQAMMKAVAVHEKVQAWNAAHEKK